MQTDYYLDDELVIAAVDGDDVGPPLPDTATGAYGCAESSITAYTTFPDPFSYVVAVPQEEEYGFFLNETRPNAAAARSALGAGMGASTSVAAVDLVWEWDAGSPFLFSDGIRATITFWAVAHDAHLGKPNVWHAELLVDDQLVASTPPTGHNFKPVPSNMSVEHTLVLASEPGVTPGITTPGSKMRLELRPADDGLKSILFDSVKAPSRMEIGFAETTVTDYDGAGRPLVQTDSNGGRTFYGYDSYGRQTGQEDPMGTQRVQAFDPAGRLTVAEVWGPIDGVAAGTAPASLPSVLLSRAESFHDEAGQVYAERRNIFDPATGVSPYSAAFSGPSALTMRAFDEAGRVVEAIDEEGQSRTWEYDERGRLTVVTDPIGNSVSYTYDEANRVVRTDETDLRVNHDGTTGSTTYVTHNVYDGSGQLVRVTDNQGETTRFGYDAQGNLAWTSDARGPLATDPLGLYSGQINTGGNVVTFDYDGQGRLVSTNIEMRAGGTAAGALESTLHITQEWAADGQLASQTDATGSTTSYEYDVHGRRTRETFADGTTKTTTYDANGNVIRTKDGAGRIINTVHSINNLPVERTTASAWSSLQQFEYDGLGRIVNATDNNGAGDGDDSIVTRTYDSLGRWFKESQNGRLVQHDYNERGDLARLTWPNGRIAEYEHDGLGRVKKVTDATGTLYSYTFDGQQVASRRAGNAVTGLVQVYTYDADRQLTGLTMPGTTALLNGIPPQFSYTYDRNDNRVTEGKTHVPSLNAQYAYDSLDRLVGMTRSNGGAVSGSLATKQASAMDWTLTGANDWSAHSQSGGIGPGSQTRTHNNMHELDTIVTSGVTATFVHDDAGQRTSDGTFTYEWDHYGRLRKVTGVPINAEYDYDAFGRRIAADYSGTSEDMAFLYDDEDLIEQRLTGSGTAPLFRLDRQFVHGPGYDEPLVMDRNDQGSGLAAESATDAADSRFFYHFDGLGSVAALSDDSKLIVEGYLYEPYGKPVILMGSTKMDWTIPGDNQDTMSWAGNPFLYTAQYYDDLTGHMYYKARYYDVNTGRFLSRDPIGIWGDGGNLGNGYGYVASSPAMFLDPFGLKLCRTLFGDGFCDASREAFCEGKSGKAWSFAPFVQGGCNYADHGDICNQDIDMQTGEYRRADGTYGEYSAWDSFECGFDFGLGFLDVIPGGGTAAKGTIKGILFLGAHADDISRLVRKSDDVASLFKYGDDGLGAGAKLPQASYQNSVLIKEGTKLGDPDLIRVLTADGSQMSQWAKYADRVPPGSPQWHWYQNKVTGQVFDDGSRHGPKLIPGGPR